MGAGPHVRGQDTHGRFVATRAPGAIAVRQRARFLPRSPASSPLRTGLVLLVLADIAAASHIDPFDFAAFAPGPVLLTGLQLAATGLRSGTPVLASHARGAGRPREARRLWRATIFAALALGSLAVLLPSSCSTAQGFGTDAAATAWSTTVVRLVVTAVAIAMPHRICLRLRNARPRGARRRMMPATPLLPPLTLAREGAS